MIKLKSYLIIYDTSKGTQILKTDKLSDITIRKFKVDKYTPNRLIYKVGNRRESKMIGFINLPEKEEDMKDIVHGFIKTDDIITKEYWNT